MLNKDYKEMLQTLLKNDVKFLVVGAYAMGVYGYVRATGDFDLFVEPSKENAKKLYNTLKEYGAPLHDINEETFTKENVIYQIGIEPVRIDVITEISGVSFKEAYASKNEIEYEGLKIPFLSKEKLIKNKKASGRAKDLLDAEQLEKK